METKTLFYHGRTPDNRRFTLAGRYGTSTTLSLGISICSEEDQFIKKVGRMKAEGRSKSKHLTEGHNTVQVKQDNDTPIKSFIEAAQRLEHLSAPQLQETFGL